MQTGALGYNRIFEGKAPKIRARGAYLIDTLTMRGRFSKHP